MTILCSTLYEEQLKAILDEMAKDDYDKAKAFKLYLDTIIVNVPTKAKKYKQSKYSDDEKIKDIEYEDYTLPFILDLKNQEYTILAIIKNN